MSLRCNCPSGRDGIVFGQCHTCAPALAPAAQRELDWLERSFQLTLSAVADAASLTRDDFTLSPPEPSGDNR